MRARRRAAALTPIALALLAPIAVAVALFAYLSQGDTARAPIAAVGAAATGPVLDPVASSSLQPRSPAPLEYATAGSVDPGLRKQPGAALVFDVDSGEVLYRSRERRILPIASLTKVMTALLVTDSTEPADVVRIPEDLRYEGSAVGLLPKGRRVRVEPLLGGLMIVSGNDAATVLARHVSGSEARFVTAMNETARLWDLECTRFATPHGLSNGDRSCAADLAVLTRLAMREPRIARVARRSSAAYRFPIKGGKLYLSGHNPLIRAGYRGALGLKTGYTDAAGRCFVGVARRGGRTIGVVLLDSFDPGRQAARLLDAAFATGLD